MAHAIGLNSHIWNNNLRSLILIATYPLVIGALAWAVAVLVGAMTMPHPAGADGALIWAQARHFGTGMIIAYWPLILTVVAVWFLVAYFMQGKMIRALSHAHPVTRNEEPALYNLLENLCISQGMTTPRLEIIETDALNAFASGIDQRSYTVTVTRGLMNRLTKDELEAVLAHELTHIINRDVRLLIVSIIFVGMIGFFAQLTWSAVRYNMFFGGRGRRDARILPLLLAVAAVLWLGYLATLLTRFAISRRREYMADAGAVMMTKNPAAMMAALMRISGRDRIPDAPDDIALMCIENTHKFMGLFTTHPAIDDRIAALSATTATPVPELEPLPEPDAAGDPAPEAARPRRKNPWIRPR